MTISETAEWMATAPQGSYERRVQPSELIFSSPVGNESWPVFFSLNLEVKLSEDEFADRLRWAWGQLLLNHPHGTSTVKDRAIFVNTPLTTEQQVNDSIKKSFKVYASTDLSPNILIRSLPAPSRPNIHYLTKSQDLILAAPHHQIDAHGAFYLFNELLTLVASQEYINSPWTFPENYSARLSQSLEMALNFNQPPTDGQSKLAIDGLTQYQINRHSLCSNPDKDLAVPPTKSDWKTIVFTEEETNQLINASKREKVTVTSIAYAGLIKSLYNYELNNGVSSYSTFMVYSLRDEIANEKVKGHVFGFFGAMWPMTFDVSNDKSEILKAVSDHLSCQKKILKNNEHAEIENPRQALTVVSNACLIAFQENSNFAEQVRHVPMISPIGDTKSRLSTTFGDAITVKKIWIGTETNSPQVPILAWTFNGQLYMNLNYNPAYYTPDGINQHAQFIKEGVMSYA
ncbi:hypothetical protein TRVA0_005S02982 [Trichomonascus vanleenenianus]|uniref:uncharacterized protein n=1 Tax=Trichomonascus vanleenenianus TaxID=2268995 RepID=UPI003ECB2699